jgi:hypothetical protein
MDPEQENTILGLQHKITAKRGYTEMRQREARHFFKSVVDINVTIRKECETEDSRKGTLA